MDEISPIGPTRVLEIRDGEVTELVIDPAALGFRATAPSDLAGGDPAENARVILAVLEGSGLPGARAAVLLNAGAALYVAGLAPTYRAGIDRATAALDEGKGMEALERLRAVFRPHAS
jgi:anthranilate phosphoribosyltransferase